MKNLLACITVSFVFICSAVVADQYRCIVTGNYEADPTPSHPHGSFSKDFMATAGTQEEALENATAACNSSYLKMNSCSQGFCRKLVYLSPKPLTPDTEFSCADDSGLQFEIIRTSPGAFVAIFSKMGAQAAIFGVQPTSIPTEADPIAFSSTSGRYSMELDTRKFRFWVNGPGLYANGTARCIKPLF